MEWQDFTHLVRDFLETSEIKTKEVIAMLLNRGDEDEDNRDEIIKSVKGMLKGAKGSPFGTGTKSTVPVKVRVVINEIGKMYYFASLRFFESLPTGVLRKDGKSGGGGYASAQEYAKVERNKIEIVLQRRYTGGKWDGSREGLGYTSIQDFEENIVGQ